MVIDIDTLWQVIQIDLYAGGHIARKGGQDANTKHVGGIAGHIQRYIADPFRADHHARFVAVAPAMKRRPVGGCGKRAVPARADGTVVMGLVASGQVQISRPGIVLIIRADLRPGVSFSLSVPADIPGIVTV